MSNDLNLFGTMHKAGETVTLPLVQNIPLDLVWCPPGEFVMGSPPNSPYANSDEKRQRLIRLTKGFWIGQIPITCEQWLTCMEDSIFFPSQPPGFPIAGINWENARAFCVKLTTLLRRQGVLEANQALDLPSETQWEYACRAGTTTEWYFGDDSTELKNHAWYRDNSDDTLHLPKQKLPNPWGLYDLYGNVQEWCLDNSYGYGQNMDRTVDPVFQFDDSSRAHKAVRGGEHYSAADSCRSAARWFSDSFNGMGDAIGLRIVCKHIDNRTSKDVPGDELASS